MFVERALASVSSSFFNFTRITFHLIGGLLLFFSLFPIHLLLSQLLCLHKNNNKMIKFAITNGLMVGFVSVNVLVLTGTQYRIIRVSVCKLFIVFVAILLFFPSFA